MQYPVEMKRIPWGHATKQNQMVTVNQVEHIRVWTQKPFAEVVRCLEIVTGLFDAAQVKEHAVAGAAPPAINDVIDAMAGKSGFMRFAALDHGAVLRLAGQPADAVRFLIGHPLIASRMTRHVIGAGLYAPLSLLVAGDKGGGTMLEYDRPSTLFKQFDNPEVSEVATELDEKFDALIRSITDIRVTDLAESLEGCERTQPEHEKQHAANED